MLNIKHLRKKIKFILLNTIYRKPVNIRLETSSLCQLKCPACIHAINDMGIIGKGTLRYTRFFRFIRNTPNLKQIELSNFGEIFLNPELEKILRYAYKKKITLTASNGVNFNNVSPRILEDLVKYNFHKITISIDGASEKTYSTYRIGGSFKKVMHNISLLNTYKEKYHSVYPKLYWQFIVFGHNEHEIKKAQTLATKHNLSFRLKLNYLPQYAPVKNRKKLRSLLGAASRNEYEKKHKKSYLLPCLQLWHSPQINWDGKLLGCCVNHTTDFGNVFDSSLTECLQGELYVYTKKMLLGLAPPRKEICCYHCDFFGKLQKLI